MIIRSRFLVAAGLVLLATMLSSASVRSEEPSTTFQGSRQPGQIDRVVTLLEVQGDILEKEDKEGKSKAESTTVVCKRQYDEKTLEIPSGAARKWRTVRYYDEGRAELKVGENRVLKPELRPNRRLVAVEMMGPKLTHFSPRGPLIRDELELLEALGNSLVLDQLLPEGPTAVGRKWKHPDEVVAALLDLEQITTNELESTLKEVTPDLARFELNGRIEGRIRGAVTQIELKSKYRFDLSRKRIDWFAMLVKEKRQKSVAGEDGLDLVTRVQVRVTPKDKSDELAEAALKDLPLEPTTELCHLSYQPEEAAWQLLHTRDWHLIDHHRDVDVFHLIERGRHVALCKISSLPKVPPERITPLAKFQEDVQRALGKNFQEFLEAREFPSEQNYRVFRVVVKGSDAEGPAQWHYYLVADDQGRQVALAFRVGEKRAETLGKGAEGLVQSLRFIEPKLASKEKK